MSQNTHTHNLYNLDRHTNTYLHIDTYTHTNAYVFYNADLSMYSVRSKNEWKLDEKYSNYLTLGFFLMFSMVEKLL